ncbi:hypothetical protein AB0C65_35680 [Nocardia sp. NPDC048505]|uniref:hypothetical protein n=1 Tax=Nocardia sp. NPDC048505 TaxID=3155756 RepID=UPI0033D8C4F9
MNWVPDTGLSREQRRDISVARNSPVGLLTHEYAEELRELLPTMSPVAKFRASRKLSAHELALWQLEALEARAPWQAKMMPTPRGYYAAGGGYMKKPLPLPMVRGTTCRVAGLFPFPVPGAAITPGLPIARQLNGSPFLFDKLAFFEEGLITAPTMNILGPNGFGKSTFLRKDVLNCLAQGRHVMWLGDVKPDGLKLCEALGEDGQVIRVGGRGGGVLNILDPGALSASVELLAPFEDRQSLMQQLHHAQFHNVISLVALVRGTSLADYEANVIDAAIRALYEGARFEAHRPPIIFDLVEQFDHPTALMLNAVAAKTDAEFADSTHRLVQSMRALVHGPLGAAFNGRSSVAFDLNKAMIDVDVSVIPEIATDLRAAVIAMTGLEAQEAVRVRAQLAAYGLTRKTVTDMVFDEVWQLFEAGGSAAIAVVDRMVRLQRGKSQTVTTCSHSISDSRAVSDSAHDQARAVGHVSRSRIKVVGPSNADEIAAQNGLIPYTDAEVAMLTSWSDSGTPTRLGRRSVHAGMGHFIVKWGDDPSKPGIPVYTVISDLERELGIHDTSASMRSDR